MITPAPPARQIPLIHIVESDDLYLADQPDVLWFDVLRSLDYHQFQATAARYYECLYTFNQQQKEQRIERRENPPAANPETQSQATRRLFEERATVDKESSVIYERPEPREPDMAGDSQGLSEYSVESLRQNDVRCFGHQP